MLTRRLFFIIFLALLLGVSLFPRTLFLKCVEWQTAHSLSKSFKAKCAIEKVEFKNGKVFFHRARLFRKGEFEAFFSAIWEPRFSLKKKEVGGFLEIADFKLVHRKTSSFVTLPSFQKWPFLSLNLHIQAKDLEVLLYDVKENGPLFQHFSFDWSQKFSKEETCGTVIWKSKDDIYPAVNFRKDASKLLVSSQFTTKDFSQVFSFLKYFLKPSSFFEHWTVEKGSFKGKMDAIFQKGICTHFKTESSLSNVKAENAYLGTLLEFDTLSSCFDVDFLNPSGFNGKLILKEGNVSFQKEISKAAPLWDLHQLNAELFIQKGLLENSSIRGNFLGSEGEIVLDASSDEFMRMNISSLSKKMNPLFSSSFQKMFQKAFPDDLLSLQASLKKEQDNFSFKGFVSVCDQNKQFYQFEFGFLLKQISFPISNFFECVKRHLLEKPKGWIKAKKIPLEKFISPFLLRKVNLSLSGFSDFEACLEDQILEITYDAENVKLDSPFYSVNVAQIKEDKAHHIFDFQKRSHQGFFPIKKGSYFQKNYDLFLPEVSGLVFFENDSILIQQIDAKWQDLTFFGDVNVQIHSLDDVFLKIQAAHSWGPASQAQALLKRFTSSFFWEIPIETGYADGSFCFQYHFHPDSELKEGKIQAVLNKASYKGLGEVREFRADVEYDFSKNSVYIKNGKGKFAIPGKETFYDLEAPTLVFTDFPLFQVDLSLDVKNENQNALALKGKTKKSEKGRDVSVESPFFSLHAHQDGNTLLISDYVLGPWRGKGELTLDKGLDIKKFSFRKENQTGFEFSGHFDSKEKLLLGKIEEFFIDLEDFAEKKLSPWPAKGFFKGSGELVWKVGEELCIHATSDFKRLEFGRVLFGDGEDLKCFYSSKCGLTVEGLSVEVPTKDGIEKYRIGQFSYDRIKKKFQFEGFDFSLPAEKLTWLTDTLKSLFPEKADPYLFESLQNFKQGEPLEGRISFEMYPDSLWVYLNLKEGSYFLDERKIELKNFLLVFDPSELQIQTQLLYKNIPYFLHLKTDSMTLTHGKLAISEKPLSFETPFGKEGLQVTWERQKNKGWHIRQVEGSIYGLNVSLDAPKRMQPSDWIFLKGKIGFDPKLLHPLLPADMKKLISRFSLSGVSTLEGDFQISKSNFKEMIYSGFLHIEKLRIANLELASLSSRVFYKTGHLILSNVILDDWAGKMAVETASFTQTGSKWALQIEKLKLEELRMWRLNSPMMKGNRRDKSFFRSLCIRTFTLDNLVGVLGEIESLRGSGALDFSTLPKKTFLTNLLFIPTEITARIGLDLTLLVPVIGTIDYEIQGGKINFLEFKEMFSEGKRSRFYLADKSPAYIDFQGNLNMKIKMKQYNLLMKLAEFFTISVKGTLFKPTYTFSNHLNDEEDS